MSPNNNLKPEPARVLVVDDETAILYAVTKTLQRIGYQVDAVSSGEEAIEFMQRIEFDVVLTDIRMGGISGVELLAKTREMSPDTSVILMTGYDSLDTAVESLRLGAHDYLKKPFSNRNIRESVTRGVERAQSMRRRRKLLSMIQSSVEELTDTNQDYLFTSRPIEEIEAATDELEPNTPVGALAAMELGQITLYPGRYQISAGGRIIDLTPTEFDLLLYLAAHRGRVVPCSELVREVRGYPLDEEEAREVIRPHISNLRRKIKLEANDTDLIVNVRGVGYRLSTIQ